jgi:hypothetical protein
MRRLGQLEQARGIIAGAAALLPAGVVPADLIAEWL